MPRRATSLRTSILFEDSAAAASGTGKTWVMVAREGDYAGYNGGQMPFSFTRQTFDQLVRNLRRHPSFVVGEDGKGSVGVIPWDFNHASERAPDAGALPVSGAPAQGWTSDLEVRVGVDGKSELWALTQFLEPARTYVKNAQYKWASVAVSFDAIDPVTGENVGAVLTSIALTNSPFIEGMQELIAASMNFYEPADSPEDAVEMLKRMFQLPATSGVTEIAAELAKISAWFAADAAPIGVDLDDIVGDMRKILNLPILTEADLVVAGAMEVLAAVGTESSGGDDAGMPPASPPPPPEASAAAAASTQSLPHAGKMVISNAKQTENSMLKIIASKFGVRETESDVEAAVDDAVDLRASLKDILKLKKTSNESITQAILEAQQETEQAKRASEMLGQFLQTLGITDPEEALAALPNLIDARKKLVDLTGELDKALQINVETEVAAAETEIAEAMAARGWEDDGIKFALSQIRGLHFPEKATNKEKVEQLRLSKAKFAEKYPPVSSDKVHLTKSIVVASKGGTPAVADVQTSALAGQKVSLSGYPGRNTIERVMAWVRGNVDGADKWNREEVFTTACEMRQKMNFEDVAS